MSTADGQDTAPLANNVTTNASAKVDNIAAAVTTKLPKFASDFVRVGLPFSLFRDAPARLTGVAVVAPRGLASSSSSSIAAPPAFVFSGGRHSLSGQGWLIFQDAASDSSTSESSTTTPILPSFTTPATPFAPPGAYNGVAALSPPLGGESNAHLFLLAGGVCQSCGSSTNCYNGERGCRNGRTPARLFAAEFNDSDDDGAPSTPPPRLTELWKEPKATSNRAATLARMVGDTPLAPTVLVAGEGGLDIFRDVARTPTANNYKKAYHVNVPNRSDSSSRFVGIDARVFESFPGTASSSLLVALGGRGSGPSASVLNFPPVSQSSTSLPSNPQHVILQSGGSTDFETAGVIVGDLLAAAADGGDVNTPPTTLPLTPTRIHVVVANGAKGAQQPYIYTLTRSPETGQLSSPTTTPLGTNRINGRAVTTARLFGSGLPDIAIATTTGTIELYSNESLQGGPLKFTYRGALQARTRSDGFEIRGLTSFRNPGASVDSLVAAAYNPGRSKSRSARCAKVAALPERADQVLASWPCHNAFVFYVK